MNHRSTAYRQLRVLLLSVFLISSSFYGRAQIITTVAGNGSIAYCCDGSPATAASIWYPYGIARDGLGNLYIGDYQSHRIRKVNASGIISTIAGTGVAGYSGDGGPATAAQIGYPYSVASDASGNVYFSDWNYCRIRRIDGSTGIITTFAGTGTCGFSGDGGPATAAQINAWGSGGGWGSGVACDNSGNVYINDYNRIRQVNSSGIINTIAGTGVAGFTGDGGPATAAQISTYWGITCDNSGNVYFFNWNYYHVRKISSSGIITSVAGTGTSGYSGDGGPATAAMIGWSYNIAADNSGNVYLADWTYSKIRRIDATGTINLIAGTGGVSFSGDGGPATAATFNRPFSIVADASDNIYIGDFYNGRVRMIIGHNRPPVFALGHSINISVCGNTTFDSVNVPLAVMDSDTWQMATWSLISGPSHGTAAISYTMPTTGTTITPHTLSYTPAFGYTGLDTFRVRVYDGYASDTTTVYVTVNPTPTTIAGTTTLAVGSYTTLATTPSGGTWSSSSPGIATVAPTTGVVTGVSQGTAVITYTMPTGCFRTTTVNVFAFAGTMITTIAGTGTAGLGGDGSTALSALLNNPWGITTDAAGNKYFADYTNNRIRKVDVSGVITTVAGGGSSGLGDGGAATAAQLNHPIGVALDGSGNLYIGDRDNNRIRKINTSGIISTYAGNGTAGYSGDGVAATTVQLNSPAGISIDGSGNLFIADYNNSRIRKVNTSGIITTVAGTGTAGFSGDGTAATTAQISNPNSVFADGSGNLFIADGANNRIRKVNSSGTISTVAGGGSSLGDGGPATAAQLNAPADVLQDALGNLYISDGNNSRIRKVNTSGTITTFAGTGTAGYSGDACAATAGAINHPGGIAMDGANNLYIADWGNHRIRKVSSNHAPFFTGGRRQLSSMCMSSVDSLNSLLAITDIDNNQGETWNVLTGAINGTVVAAYTATSTGGTITPTGLVYTPTIGFTGLDSFTVRVYDCSGGSDTTKIVVTVNPPPSAISGSPTVCVQGSLLCIPT